MTSALSPATPARHSELGIAIRGCSPCASDIAASRGRAMHSANSESFTSACGLSKPQVLPAAPRRADACPAGADIGQRRRAASRWRQSAGRRRDRRHWRHWWDWRSRWRRQQHRRSGDQRHPAAQHQSDHRSLAEHSDRRRRAIQPAGHRYGHQYDQRHGFEHRQPHRSECARGSRPHSQRRRQHRQPGRSRHARLSVAKPPQRRAASRRAALRRRRGHGPAARRT